MKMGFLGCGLVRTTDDLLTNSGEDAGTTKTYLEEKLKGAQWIIRSIDQRNKTIVKVVTSLIKFQEAFLEKGGSISASIGFEASRR